MQRQGDVRFFHFAADGIAGITVISCRTSRTQIIPAVLVTIGTTHAVVPSLNDIVEETAEVKLWQPEAGQESPI